MLTLANGMTIDAITETVKKPKRVKLPRGFILYKGASVLDGQPIVVIATLETNNAKTGNMVQTWILREDVNPLTASKEKLDVSVCGMCPQRRSLGGACYVTLHQAPRAVYQSYVKGNYQVFDSEIHSQFFAGRSVRLGAYGDPAAVPVSVWEKVVKLSKNHTGYTHQLGHKNFDKRIAQYCMISADTEKQALKAQKQGFKTFRVKTENMNKLENEITCLSDSHGITCLDCGLCDGQRANVVIDVHGQLKNRFDKFERII